MSDGESVMRPETAKSARRAFDVLELLSERPSPTSAGAISHRSGIPRSSLHYLLVLLRDRRYIAYDQKKRTWTLGPRLGELCSDSPLLIQGIAVLRAFELSPHNLSTSEIAAATDLTRPVVASITSIMTRYGLLKAHPDGTYSPGLELVSLASRVSWADRLRRTANSHLVRLRDASGEHIPIEGTATGMALSDDTNVHTSTDSIEAGVTAIVCAVKGSYPPAAVGITGPTWRVNEAGVRRLSTMVRATARETGADLAGNS